MKLIFLSPAVWALLAGNVPDFLFFGIEVYRHNGPQSHWCHWVKRKIQVLKPVSLKFCTWLTVTTSDSNAYYTMWDKVGFVQKKNVQQCQVIRDSAWITVRCIKSKENFTIFQGQSQYCWRQKILYWIDKLPLGLIEKAFFHSDIYNLVICVH